MEDTTRLIVQYLHVLSGLMWLGAGFYTLFVQTPALMAAPAAARGPVLASLAPRQVTYLLRLGELTILTGLARVVVSGRAGALRELDSTWEFSIAIGLVLSVILLGIGHAILKPGITRLLTLGPKAAQGDQAAAAAAEAITARFKTIGMVQIVLGFTIVLVMVLARFS